VQIDSFFLFFHKAVFLVDTVWVAKIGALWGRDAALDTKKKDDSKKNADAK
jgi:hypothetical protein